MRKQRIVSIVFHAALCAATCVRASAQAGPQDHFVLEPDLAWGSPGNGDGQFSFGFGSPYYFSVGMAADRTNLFVGDVSNHRVQVFDLDGTFVRKWGSSGSVTGKFSSPQGLAIDEQYVFVCDTGNSRVQVFTKNGDYVRHWGAPGSADGQFNQAKGLAVDTQNVYVADTYNHRIQVFDKSGTFLRKWGTSGSAAGQMTYPVSVAVDTQNVYVYDLGNSRLQVFDTAGNFIRSWPLSYVSTGGGNWVSAFALAVDTHNVFVTHAFVANNIGDTPHLQVYDKNGNLLWDYTALTPLRRPVGIATGNPSLYVMDWGAPTRILPMRRYFHTLGAIEANPIPLVDVVSVAQREGTPILDVDYVLTDENDTAVTLRAVAFAATSLSAQPRLGEMVPMLTFVDGTATNIGPGVAPGVRRRLSWDMEADQLDSRLPNFGNVKVAVMAKDARNLLDLHFLSIPEVGTNSAFQINRSPLFDADFLPLWFWLLASGDPGIDQQGNQVVGVGAPFDGQILAVDTNTTAAGRTFLYERLNVSAATPLQLHVARQASSSGTVTQWTPRREPPAAGYKVNEFNFVTSPTNGWWVVRLP